MSQMKGFFFSRSYSRSDSNKVLKLFCCQKGNYKQVMVVGGGGGLPENPLEVY